MTCDHCDEVREQVARAEAAERERDTAIEQMRALGVQLQQAFDEVAELRRVVEMARRGLAISKPPDEPSGFDEYDAARDAVAAALARPAEQGQTPDPAVFVKSHELACGERRNGWICTRHKGHDGEHIAHCTEPFEIMERWPSVPAPGEGERKLPGYARAGAWPMKPGGGEG